MNVLYFGHMKSSFARVDADLLKYMADLKVVDMAEIVWKHSQLPTYFVRYWTTILPELFKRDVVWMWTADYPLLPVTVATKLLRKKLVVALTGYEVHNDPEVGYGIQGSFIRGYIARWTIKHADVVIVQSIDYVKRVTDLVPEAEHNICVMAGSLDVKYTPGEKTDTVMTACCTYKNSIKVKGIDTFKRAMSQLPFKGKVVHDRPHREMIAEMKTAKVYCQLSYIESFGQAVLEAMACGCVPVVTDRGALPELVGDTGVIVPWNDVEATAEAIQKAMTMDGSKARRRAIEYFSVERKYESLRVILGMVE